MKKPNYWIQVLLGTIVCILLGLWIGITYDDQDPLNVPSQIPPPPDTERAMYYDFNEEEWKYLLRGARAKGVKRDCGMTEDDLQEYLEKKVDGYLEDTYWGEEYDLLDREDPD